MIENLDGETNNFFRIVSSEVLNWDVFYEVSRHRKKVKPRIVNFKDYIVIEVNF